MKKIVKVSLFSLLLAGAAGYPVLASQQGHAGMDMSPAKKMFLEKRDINGYTVSFHVMEAADGIQHGGSHNLMVKIESQATAVEGVKINSKVIFPDGSEESNAPMKMGEWYSASYDLSAKGEHQLMVLFKTIDGKKHFGGVKYMPN